MFRSRFECSRKATSPKLLPLGLPTKHLVQGKEKKKLSETAITRYLKSLEAVSCSGNGVMTVLKSQAIETTAKTKYMLAILIQTFANKKIIKKKKNPKKTTSKIISHFWLFLCLSYSEEEGYLRAPILP